MENDNYKGLLLRLTHVTYTNVLTNLNERLGALQVEAMKRGLNYE